MNIESLLKKKTSEAIKNLFNHEYFPDDVTVQEINKGFEGDTTVVIFPFTKFSKNPPEETGRQVGEYLKANCSEIIEYNVIKGFLNITVSPDFWFKFFLQSLSNTTFPFDETKTGKSTMVEYCGPNTNKPLHLGHLRNILLGYSLSEVLKANGDKVIKVNMINDRGIHICKSMLAWKKFGKGETPDSSGMKGDHFVGKYYVLFDKHFKDEVKELISKGMSPEAAEEKAPMMREVKEMLRQWEAGDDEVIKLWELMNSWVYDGFDKTFKILGIDFEKIYYESQTYLLGKQIIEEGLQKGVLYKKEDNSIWVDLTADGLDNKLLLRSDGTSVYITQDIGTAVQRYQDYKFNELIYVVGNEQEYHFKVLKLILEKLGYEWAKEIYHFSYGMVDLPSGKMKSREGTVVDADDLIDEMITTAEKTTVQLGKIENFTNKEAQELYQTLGLGALKYHILKVDPKKRMLFDPEESIDFNGHTGPFIQYSYARIQSLIRKSGKDISSSKNFAEKFSNKILPINSKEKDLIRILYKSRSVIKESAKTYNPALIANYIYELAKQYNQFYHDYPVLKEPEKDIADFRLYLSMLVGKLIKTLMQLLGIQVPEKM